MMSEHIGPVPYRFDYTGGRWAEAHCQYLEGLARWDAVEERFEKFMHYWLDGIRDDEHNVIFLGGTAQGLAQVKRGRAIIEVDPDRLVLVENGPALSGFVPDPALDET